MKIMLIMCMCAMAAMAGCSSKAATQDTDIQEDNTLPASEGDGRIADAFVSDSAYSYVARQVEFGARVPGSAAHAACGEWLEAELKRHGAQTLVQQVSLITFDGTPLPARNILGQFNPHSTDRTLLVAHWDTRPWADEDPDPSHHREPVPGANDGASGVGVLLEMARVIGAADTDKGVDILFVDAEDYGAEGDDESWALGARAFVQNPPITGYRPARVILLDMVGGVQTCFLREGFSDMYAPSLIDDVWRAAAQAGHSSLFVNGTGGYITDDHVEFIKGGIPAIDIIGVNPQTGGFVATWHTLSDTLDHIDPATLRAVGQTLLTYLHL